MAKFSVKNVKSSTWLRTISLIFALFNQSLVFFGKDQLPFTEDTVYQFCSLGLTIITSILTWWKNNSFTEEAIEADEVLNDLKNNKQNNNKTDIVEDKNTNVETTEEDKEIIEDEEVIEEETVEDEIKTETDVEVETETDIETIIEDK